MVINTRDFAVASASQLRGSMLPPPRSQPLNIQTQQHQHESIHDPESNLNSNKEKTGQLKRASAVRKSVRFTQSTTGGSEKNNAPLEDPADTDIFTQSPHASRGSVSSIDFPEHLLPQASLTEPFSEELLQPVAYSPNSRKADNRVADALATGIIRSDTVRHKVGVLEYSNRVLPKVPGTDRIVTTELQVDTDSHKRNLSNTSNASSSSDQPRRKKASPSAKEIYFTPIDAHSSKIFLSSPLNSPTLPQDYESDEDDDLPTPRATTLASLTRPPSAIFVGHVDVQTVAVHSPDSTVSQAAQIATKPAIRITYEQLDRLVAALARSKLIRKHLQQDWFDPEDVPDDDSVVSTFSSVSLPTLTSASTLYSQQNARSSASSTEEDLPRYAPEDPNIKLSTTTSQHSDSILICDPKVYGTPATYVSTPNNTIVGTRTFLNAPDGSDVECSLRIEPSSGLATVRVLLQILNQVVDRKSGTKSSLLSAEVDVTPHIAKAAIAELAEGTSLQVSDIAVCESPTSPSRNSTTSSSIDWIAIADDLQSRDTTNDMIETAISVFSKLDSDTASMSTLSLLSHLTRISDQYQDLLILKPTSYHSNGIPQSIKIPYCSRRLYEDWYTDPRGSQAGEKVGESAAARMFQRGIVSSVAKRAGEDGSFKIEGFWENRGRVRQVLKVVPMFNGEGGVAGAPRERVWCCFVLGEWDLSP